MVHAESASGAGKSHIAKALLLIGCQKTFRCRYVTATMMLRELLASLADKKLEQKLKRFLTPEILLIDEVGFDRLEQHDARNANLFHKVIDGRYCKGSTIITTNIDFKELGDYLGDPVITAATVDRMIHHSIIINIEGPSWRLHESKQLNARKIILPKILSQASCTKGIRGYSPFGSPPSDTFLFTYCRTFDSPNIGGVNPTNLKTGNFHWVHQKNNMGSFIIGGGI